MKPDRLSTSNLVYDLLKKIETLILSTLFKKVSVFGKYLFGRLCMIYDYVWMDKYHFQCKKNYHIC